uniref:Uncharacterized protein n=2 Tax=Clytia hemisphaerica TaxID=252671 RepID=A0A7M5XLI6_9CNID
MEWSNIKNYGSRIPAVFFQPNSNKLTVCYAINGKKNHCWNSKIDLPTNKFSKIIIKQKLVGGKYYYTITIDSKKVYNIVNTKPITLYRARIFLSDPWYPAAQAFVKQVKVSTTSTGGFKLQRGKLINVIPRVDREWFLSFDIKSWTRRGSILHLTTGRDSGAGSRIPGIWFLPKSRALSICYPINLKSKCIKTNPLPANNWYNVRIYQKFDKKRFQFKLTIEVNNQQFGVFINWCPKSYQGVRLFAADPFYSAALASVRNIVFRNIQPAW